MPDIKDYTTGIEVDSQGILTVDADGVDFGPDIDVGAHQIYWVEGLSGDWSKYFGARIDSGTANGIAACWGFASELNNLLYLLGTSLLHSLSVFNIAGATNGTWIMRERYLGVSYNASTFAYTDTVPYYMTLTYVDSTKLCTLDIFSDINRTINIHSTGLTLHISPNPTHIYRFNGYGSNQAGRLLSGRYGNFVPGAAFNPAWARNSNVIIGGGIIG